MAGAAGTVVAGAMVAAFAGPWGFLLLALLPVDIAAAILVRRRRLALRSEAVRKASGPGRDTATVERAEDAPGSARRPEREARDGAAGSRRQVEALVYWTAAAPGLTGIAAWDGPRRRAPLLRRGTRDAG